MPQLYFLALTVVTRDNLLANTAFCRFFAAFNRSTLSPHLGVPLGFPKNLYFPAISAIRYNPIIMALADRLRAKGKVPMEIIGAAMRKLLRLAYGVLKTRQFFDPNFIVNQQNTA